MDKDRGIADMNIQGKHGKGSGIDRMEEGGG